MNPARRTTAPLALTALALAATPAPAQDWPGWLGAGRDGKATGFQAPATWPKELTQKWKVTIGDGVATPSLVGDKLFTFSREESSEVVRCLNAVDGQEVWSDRYETLGADGPASSFSGPRCSPAVAEGKVVTLGVRGALSCYDAGSGKLLWRKDEYPRELPRFFTSASPLIADGLCVAQLGGSDQGGTVAFDLATGDEKWRWDGGGPDYASPTLASIGGSRYVIAETNNKIVALALADGTLAWETPFEIEGRGYNASTPFAAGDTLYYAGSNRGVTAVKLSKDGDGLKGEELWKNTDNSVQFNTPIVKDGHLYGLTGNNQLFCINTESGETAWAAPLGPEQAGGGGGRGEGRPRDGGDRPRSGGERPQAGGDRPPGGPGGDRPGGGERRRGGGGGGGRGGYGSLVDAGSVLVALTPAGELVAFKPGADGFQEVARIKVAEAGTYAYPVLSGNRVIIKDQNDLALYAVE